MFDQLIGWVAFHPLLTASLAVVSVVGLVGSIIALPFVVAALPEDYFLAPRPLPFQRAHPVLSLSLRLIKNAIGWCLVLSGLLMLVLPGQGLLTILVGLILSDFPGKSRIERRLAAEPKVLAALNWLRSRARRPPLKAPPLQRPAEEGLFYCKQRQP